MRALRFVVMVGFLAAACEDGPDQIFEPYSGNPNEQNGYTSGQPYVESDDKDVPASKGFEEGGDDSVGRARFCDEGVMNELIQWMVVQPIIPDTSVGGVPLRNGQGGPKLADELVGPNNPEDPDNPTFCDPWGIYLNAFTWGPEQELIVFFNEETRLIEGILAYYQYLGTLEGAYTVSPGETQKVLIKTREHVTFDLGGPNYRELTVYNKQHPNSWLNPVNINALYKMFRETFWPSDYDDPFTELNFDCIERQVCDIIYTAQDESRPQQTVVAFHDSGIFLIFNPDGTMPYIEIDPVRIQQFEVEAEISFDGTPLNDTGAEMAMTLTSKQVGGCILSLENGMLWSDVLEDCNLDEAEAARADYSVHTQRDAVDVGFNAVSLTLLRDVTAPGAEVFKDGEHPKASDLLTEIGFSRMLFSKVEEFVPSELALIYLNKLELRLQDSVFDPDGPGGLDPSTHPFNDPRGEGVLPILPPSTLSNQPERIGELFYDILAVPSQGLIDDGRHCTDAANDELAKNLPVPTSSTIIPGTVTVRLDGDGTWGVGTAVAEDDGNGQIVEVALSGISGTINYDDGRIKIVENGSLNVWSSTNTVYADLQTKEKRSWLPDVATQVQESYDDLTDQEKLMVDPRVKDPIFLIEPFVDTVLEVFSYGLSDYAQNDKVFKVFSVTDDRRWSIGDAHFFSNGVAYRLGVQYSMNYGAVTWVSVSRGFNKVDQILSDINTAAQTDLNPLDPEPYYSIGLSQQPEGLSFKNPYALNQRGITVLGFDRQLEMLDVRLKTILTDGSAGPNVLLTVPGGSIDDENGYLRQLRGERWEFVPANVVELYGKETQMAFWVEADGAIGKITEGNFKGSIELCDNLLIRYGDNVRQAILSWQSGVSDAEFRNCELVYNYSANGNVLDSVVSLGRKVSVAVMDERAISASIWR